MASDVFGAITQNHTTPTLTNEVAIRSQQNLQTFSVDEVGFFEGPEKLLEVWFDLCPLEDGSMTSSDLDNDYDKGLRIIPRSKWEELLKLVNCEILSYCSNEYMDAYLLSESSLFVSGNRFILKTCGSTTLLYAVQPLLQLVSASFPSKKVTSFFYSHRNFQKPHLQPHPHSSFDEEARYLDEIFDDGAAYALGRINGDAWYLYSMCVPHPVQENDQTLEILMTDLDPNVMALYSPVAYTSDKLLMQETSIDQIVPGATLDAKIFEPCGFSVNAIIKGDEYFTIHVTPQIECAWVSFETNFALDSYSSIITKVLSIFKPGTFTVSLFFTKTARTGESSIPLENDSFRGYRCKDKQSCSFSAYELIFRYFTQTSKNKDKPLLYLN